MADFVDQKLSEMEARLNELRPMVEEYDRLGAAVAALSWSRQRTSRREGTARSQEACPPQRRGQRPAWSPEGLRHAR